MPNLAHGIQCRRHRPQHPAADPQSRRDQGHLGRVPAAPATTAASSTPRAGTTGSGPTASASTASTSTTSMTRDARCREIMLNWFRDRFAAGTPTKNINTVAPFLTLAYLYEESPDSSWLPYLDEWAEWLMDGLPRTEENGFQHIVFNSENREQLWDDTLMMSVLPLAKIGKLLGRPHYVEEARRQFMLHIKYLVDRKTGLWFHGWTFDGRHHFANALWARGNCWVTIAIPEFIELLDLQPGDALARIPARDPPAADPHAGETPGRGRPVAHAHRRSEVLSRSLRHRRLRLRHPEIRAQGLHRRRVRRSRHPRGEGRARQHRQDRASSRTSRSARRCSTIWTATARSR